MKIALIVIGVVLLLAIFTALYGRFVVDHVLYAPELKANPGRRRRVIVWSTVIVVVALGLGVALAIGTT